MNDLRPILVLGSSGKTGRRVVKGLMERGNLVRLGSRSTDPAFDWLQRPTWDRAIRGARAIYITYQPDLAVPGAVEAIRRLTEVALAEGVRRLVLLSGRGEEEALGAERVLQNSGADWTVIRASWFAQNFNEAFLVESIQAGEVVLPIGDVKEPFIDADDIADIAVAALTDDRHIGQAYEVTGPRLLTFAEAVAEIAQAIGRPVAYRQVPLDDYVAMLRGHGVPDDYIWLLQYLFTTVLDGRNAHATDGVTRALGRPARDFRDFARSAAASGVWRSPQS